MTIGENLGVAALGGLVALEILLGGTKIVKKVEVKNATFSQQYTLTYQDNTKSGAFTSSSSSINLEPYMPKKGDKCFVGGLTHKTYYGFCRH